MAQDQALLAPVTEPLQTTIEELGAALTQPLLSPAMTSTSGEAQAPVIPADLEPGVAAGGLADAGTPSLISSPIAPTLAAPASATGVAELPVAGAAGSIPVAPSGETAGLSLDPASTAGAAIAPPSQLASDEVAPGTPDLTPDGSFGDAVAVAGLVSAPGVPDVAEYTSLASTETDAGLQMAGLANALPMAAPAMAAPQQQQQQQPPLADHAALAHVPMTVAVPLPDARSDVAPVPGPGTLVPRQEVSAEANLAARDGQGIDFSPGQQTFPTRGDVPTFSTADELILQIQVAGLDVTDTIVAYGNRDGVYLPLGEMSRILDLAIRISDDGHYASGWFLSEDRTLTIDLRSGVLTTAAGSRELPRGMAVAFEGELFLHTDAFAQLLPLTVATDLRGQRVVLTTLESFPFEERMRRDGARARLGARSALPEQDRWPRVETPYLALSAPLVDVELRGLSDTSRGTRVESDLRMAGDLLWMTARTNLSATSQDGLVAALVELGRRDPDGELLGPLRATEFQLGDVATTSLPLGLRGTSGRGAAITNQSFESASVFDRIDLRGVLPDGYEVELYRNDILLNSTRETVNGQYEFVDVPVDYGLNVFRLVFYGPQGQRREEVRRISVGDGRLASGQFVYSAGIVQSGVNLLGVTGPDFHPGARYGDWQAVSELAYGFTPAMTGTLSAAFFEDSGLDRWIIGTGLRSGLGGLAIRVDAGIANEGAHAGGLGIGGRALGGAFTLSHFEYGGGFIDETHALSSEPVRRATEIDFSTSLNLGGLAPGAYLPISSRVRHLELADGQVRTNAALRGSLRLPGVLASNTLEFSRTSSPASRPINQLYGNFDLGTFNQSQTQVRGSLGYRVSPGPTITTVSAEVNQALGEEMTVRGSAAYSFLGNDVSLAASAVRDFDRFTLAVDGRYAVKQGDYVVALRLGFSLGRDPVRRRIFAHRPGLATSGALAANVFRDLDGDGLFGAGDEALQGIDIAAQNAVAQTDAEGTAFIGELGDGNRVTVQIDPSTLPDIALAPASRGIEIVPRAGRVQTAGFAVVALSEVEGSVTFGDSQNGRGVSGLRLQMRNAAGEMEYFVRTERGGYYFFEQVKPGTYDLVIDPEQAARLGICLGPLAPLVIDPAGDVYSLDVQVSNCDEQTGVRAVDVTP